MTLRHGPESLATLIRAGALLLILGMAARADEPLPTTDDDASPAPRTERAEPPPREKPAKKESLYEKLKRVLDPEAKGPESDVKQMERAVTGMRTASRQLEARQLDAETLKTQRQVVDDLEELLKRLQEQQANPQKPEQQSNQTNSPPQNRDQHEKPQKPDRMQKPQQDPQNSGGQAPKPNGNRPMPETQQTEAEKSREAEERREAARRALAEEERRQRMVKDVWGHLPPHLRESMLNSFSEKYLPKYEDLVKRYYESLAEKNRKRGTRP
jgi:hypothetical protein